MRWVWLAGLGLLACTAAPVAAPPPEATSAPAPVALATAPPRIGPIETAVAVARTVRPDLEPAYVDPRDLAAKPDEFVGLYVFVIGKAAGPVSAADSLTFQLNAQPRGRAVQEPVMVRALQAPPPIRRDDCYLAAGIGAGPMPFRPANAPPIPLLISTIVEPFPANNSGALCAPP